MHDLYTLSTEDKRMKQVNDRVSPFKMFSASIEMGQESPGSENHSWVPLNRLWNEGKK